MKSPPIFLTGAPRSGTTLLDKLLSVPGRSRIFSQPLPLLFVAVKAQFLRARGAPAVYPLNDTFGTNYHDPKAWISWLKEEVISEEVFQKSLKDMADFSGQLVRPDNMGSFLATYSPATFDSALRQYISWMSNYEAIAVGLKEVVCEEFLTFLLESGWKCLHVIRDPRDMVASLDHGNGPTYTGRRKPLLFNVRAWRKSVAQAFQCAQHPLYKLVRYEDLVTRPHCVLEDLADFLEIQELSDVATYASVLDDAGKPWRSNSSHSPSPRINTESVKKYPSVLGQPIIAAIEALCLPEMISLGYEDLGDSKDQEALIAQISITEELERPELATYLWRETAKSEEKHRARLLLEGDYQPEYFLFEECFNALNGVPRGLRLLDIASGQQIT